MDPENIQGSENASKKSLRLLRPSIVVLCGPAGCGKSTFAERHFRATQIISSDWARGRVADDERDQRYNAQAFALVRFLIEQRLTLNRLCVIDSTALAPQDRRELLDLARRYQVPTTLLLFNVPLQTCIERDEKRERSVGRSVVERQYQAFEQSKETVPQEGFDQVVVFQDGEQENVQIEILFRPVARQPQHAERHDPRVPKRFERPAQPAPQRQGGSGPNGDSAAKSGIPPAPGPADTARPAQTPAAASISTAVAPPTAEPAAAVARAQPPAAPRAASTASVNQASAPTHVVSSAKTSPPAGPRTAPAAQANSGEK
jgi:predicted kinase